jgi:hypothetical protein
MESPVQGPAVRLRLGATLSLLVILCAPASSARAGCSAHYVTSRTQAVAESFALDPLILSDSVRPVQNRAPAAPPAPCSGALCSGTPAVPVSAVPPSMPESDTGWAISIRPVVLAGPGSIGRSADDARLVPLNHPSSIFHPPR